MKFTLIIQFILFLRPITPRDTTKFFKKGFGFSDGLCRAGFSCRNFKNSSPPAPCPPGTFSILGQHDCKPCAPGYYTNHSAFESCTACLADFMCPFADQYLVACPVGTCTYCTRQSCCSLCPAGTYTTHIASIDCVKCPAGASCRPVSPPSCAFKSFGKGLIILICRRLFHLNQFFILWIFIINLSLTRAFSFSIQEVNYLLGVRVVASWSRVQKNLTLIFAIMSASASSERFHTIVIRNDLPKIEKQYQAEKPMDLPEASYWIQHVVNDVGGGRWNSSMDSNRFKMQHMISNGAYTSSAYSHAVFQAYLSAYNSHEDIVLSPDDLWLMVAIYFAKYVNANAEKLRHLFVNHEGKVKLTIEQMQREPDWNAFLESMRIKIGENVKNDVVSLLTANYSTTGKVELMLFCATIMNTFKNYFDYGLVMTMCGIRKLHFLGTLDDWLLLRDKTKQLQSFTMHNDEFSTYVEGLLPVFNQFISTYQGNVDNKFWDKIFNVEHVGAGSG
ncbi:unnamed protein product [Rotaria socialis]